MQQIIINLVGNSIKFTQVGQIEVTTDIAARHERSIEIVIEVTDTGIGIAPDVLPRLFQPFSQAETGHERRFEGTGLGLAISKGLAEAMGGTILVRSEVGRVRLFSSVCRSHWRSMKKSAPAGPSRSRVLVVDDVALNRDIVTELIRAEGCEAMPPAPGRKRWIFSRPDIRSHSHGYPHAGHGRARRHCGNPRESRAQSSYGSDPRTDRESPAD